MPARSPNYMNDKREHIVSATISCLEKLGLSQTSMTDVCSEAKISRGALYVHFTSKDELLEAVIKRLGDESFSHISFESVNLFTNSIETHLRFMIEPSRRAMVHVEADLLSASRMSDRLSVELSQAISQRLNRLKTGLKKLGNTGCFNDGVDAVVAAHAIDAFLIGSVQGSMNASPTRLRLKALRLIFTTIFRNSALHNAK